MIHPKWFVVFCLALGVFLGYLTAAVFMSFFSLVAGEEHQGLFVLAWMFGAVIFFAGPMEVAARARALRRQRQVIRERVGDLDYEPQAFPIFGTRAPEPKTEEIQIKAPDIGDRRFRRFLSRGRSGDQRMADYLKSLELQAEMQRAKGSTVDGQKEREASSD